MRRAIAGATAADIALLKPLFDRVLVQVAEAKAASKGGVLLPGAPRAEREHAPCKGSRARPRAESAKEKPLVGVIVAAGPGKKDEEMKLAVGDKVVYFKYAGDKMMVRAPLVRRSARRLCAHRVPCLDALVSLPLAWPSCASCSFADTPPLAARTTRAPSSWCCTRTTSWASCRALSSSRTGPCAA